MEEAGAGRGDEKQRKRSHIHMSIPRSHSLSLFIIGRSVSSLCAQLVCELSLCPTYPSGSMGTSFGNRARRAIRRVLRTDFIVDPVRKLPCVVWCAALVRPKWPLFGLERSRAPSLPRPVAPPGALDPLAPPASPSAKENRAPVLVSLRPPSHPAPGAGRVRSHSSNRATPVPTTCLFCSCSCWSCWLLATDTPSLVVLVVATAICVVIASTRSITAAWMVARPALGSKVTGVISGTSRERRNAMCKGS